jgi:hypothetical protein
MNAVVRSTRAQTRHLFTNEDVLRLQAEGFFPDPKKSSCLMG